MITYSTAGNVVEYRKNVSNFTICKTIEEENVKVPCAYFW